MANCPALLSFSVLLIGSLLLLYFGQINDDDDDDEKQCLLAFNCSSNNNAVNNKLTYMKMRTMNHTDHTLRDHVRAQAVASMPASNIPPSF